MGYFEDLQKSAQGASVDARETATPHLSASIAPPAGFKALTAEEARAWVEDAKSSPLKRHSLMSPYGDYAQRVVAADRVARGYVAQERHNSPISKVLGAASKALDTPLNYVQRATGTVQGVANQAGVPWLLMGPVGGWGAVVGWVAEGVFDGSAPPMDIGALSSGDTWRQSWNATRNASPGQLLFGGLTDTDPTGTPAQRAQEYAKWGKETWAGRLSTGTADFAMNVFADPLNILGAPIEAVRKAGTVIKVGEAADTIKAADALKAGEKVETSRSAAKTGAKLNDFISQTEGKTVAQLLKMKPFQQSSDPGLLAHLFTQADGVGTPDEVWRAKRDIMAVAIGDPAAKARLAEKHADLVAQLERVQSAPELNQLERFWAVDVAGEATEQNPVRFVVDVDGEINHLNQPKWEAELQAAAKQIDEHLQLINRQIATSGEVRQVGTKGLEAALERGAVNRASKESVIYNGALGRTITVTTGTLGARAPHTINVADARIGVEDFSRSLKRSRWLPKEIADDYLAKYAAASGRADRSRIVEEAESVSHKYLAKELGIPQDEADALIQAGKMARSKWRAYLHGKAFSGLADDTNIVSGVGPDATGFAFDKAFVQSQLRDTVPFMDPGAAKAALKYAKKHQISGALLDGKKTGSEALSDLASGLMANYMRIWKLSALMRVGYLPRVQIDSQLRNIAAMGALHWAATAGEGLVNELKNLNPLDRKFDTYGDTIASKKAIKRGRTDRASILTKPETFGEGNYPIQPAMNYDELLKTERLVGQDGNTLSRALIDRTVGEQRQLLENDTWDVITPADPNWTDFYLRDVNQQVRKSTAARAILDGIRDDEFIRLATRKGGPLRDEWLNFSDYPEYDGDASLWLADVKRHVEYMLPDPVLREKAAQRNLTVADIKDIFDNGGKRMKIHGSSYTPIGGKGAVFEAFNAVQSKWYKWMSDVPEQVMARQPLYNHSFRTEMRDRIARWEAENPGERLSSKELDNMRKSADSLARKRVNDVLFDLEKMSPGSGLRNVLFPFFSAWEDTMKKWGSLFYEKPLLLRRTQQAFSIPANMGLMHDDEEARADWLRQTLGHEPTQQEVDGVSGKFIYLPKGWVNKILPEKFHVSDDYTFRVDPKSFNIVFQGDPPLLPGPGPLVQIAANWLVSMDKSTADAVDKNWVWRYILPYGATPEGNPAKALVASVVPAFAESIWQGGTGNGDQYADVFNMLRNAEFSRYYRGERKDEPSADEISRRTRNYFLVRAFMQNVMPVNVKPGPSEEIQFYIDQAHSIQTQWRLQHPDGKRLGEEDPTPEEIFYERYPNFFDLSISLSQNTTGVTASLEAQSAAEKYKRAIANDPEIGWALAGPDNLKGEFSPGIYDYQRNKEIGLGTDQTYRSKKDPRENFYESSIRRGWSEYYKTRALVDAELDARGLKNINARGASDLKDGLAKAREFIANKYPGWGEDFNQQDSSKVEGFIASVQRAWETYPDLKQRKDMQLLQSYIESRKMIRDVLATRPKHSLSDPTNADLADGWATYTKYLTDQDLAFSYMYSRILEGDDVNKELLGIG